MPQPAFTFKIHGLKETMDALEQLPTVSMRKGVVRKALEKASIPIRDAAITNAQGLPFDSEEIAKSIRVGTLKKSQQHKHPRTVVARYVGASHPLAHLFEFGTARRFTKKKGAYRGIIPAMPFLRQAWDSQKMAALGLLKDEIWKELAKAAKRLAKRAERGTLTAKQKAGLAR